MQKYRLKKVDNNDCELLFEWANEEEVRNNSINTDIIVFEKHVEWFNQKIQSQNCVMFKLEANKIPVGQIRFDYNENERAWEIDYSVSKANRGKGLGKILLYQGIRLFNRFPMIAFVRRENKKSITLFASLGFINSGSYELNGRLIIKYFMEKKFEE